MFDVPAIAFLFLFLGILIFAARAGASSVDSFVNLFGTAQMPPRPRGTQENDLPPFAFR